MPLPFFNALLFAAEALAASLILPALAWALCRLLPNRAAMRHLIWLSVFTVLLLLPLLALLVPSQMIWEQAAPMTIAGAMAYRAPVVADTAPASFWTVSHIVMALGAVWAAGLVGNLLGLGVGIHGLQRLRRASIAFAGHADVRLADCMPLTFGWLKPMILLPLDAPDWPRERLDAVLGHERAHVARRDNLSHLVALLTCAFYWPNPFLWLARDVMRGDAEIAADDCVLAMGMTPSAYAAELVELTAEYHGHAPFAALAMASPSSLEARVTSVLSPTPSRKGVTGMDVLRIASLGSAAAVMLAFARPGIAEAQAPAMVQAAPPAPAVSDMPEPPPAPRPPGPPPAPPAMPVMTAPPAPPSPPAAIHAGHGWREHAGLIEADKARVRETMAQVKVAMASIRPEIERIAAEAKAHQAEAEAMKQRLPQIQAAVARAMVEVRPIIHQALAESRVEERVEAALEKAQRKIDAALANIASSDRPVTVTVPGGTATSSASGSATTETNGVSVTTDVPPARDKKK